MLLGHCLRVANFVELRKGEVRYSLAPDNPGPPARKQEEGRPVKWEKEETEDRPNAVTLITLRLPTEMRLCQVAIIGYTSWPFLNPTQLRSGGPTLGGP